MLSRGTGRLSRMGEPHDGTGWVQAPSIHGVGRSAANCPGPLGPASPWHAMAVTPMRAAAISFRITRFVRDGFTRTCLGQAPLRKVSARGMATAVTGDVRSFVFDILTAYSCREHGVVLVTGNVRDMLRIRRVFTFDHSMPYPDAS